MDYMDAALQPINIGDCLCYGSARGEISFGLITAFDDILPPPEFLRGDNPADQATQMPYASRAGAAYPGKHTFPRRYFRQPDGSTHVEWAPYWAYRVQVQRLESPGDRWHASRGLIWLSYPTRIAKIALPDWAREQVLGA
mgnify:FL=1